MSESLRASRPGSLNFITIASFVLSILNVLWLVVLALLVLLGAAATWLGGPVFGALGTAIGAVVLLILVVQTILSLLLFVAAWKTWKGDPAGRGLHQTWAWIIVVLDVLDLIVTGGMDLGAWVRLTYAFILLYVMSRSEVKLYFGGTA
ncbi:hypothetical protein BH23PLA1_BH23PLA1_18280 [soil metagenome]